MAASGMREAMIVQTAAEAFDRYQAALSADGLIQSKWHAEKDGRQLACALGVLGDGVSSPEDCPAQIMPRWLAQMVPWFFDNQPLVDATAWGSRFYAELKRVDGKVPFSVVHDWHAHVVGPLAIEVATMLKRPTEPHAAVMALHERALAGDVATVAEWRETLKPANADAYAYAYANADAYAYANADAYANAYANANANANAYRVAIKRMANGMIDCLARLPTL